MASPFPIALAPSETRRIREATGSDAEAVLMKVTRKAEGQKILPIPGQENILITSALPYVNNVPHLGNIIGSTLSADVYARYSRTRNRNTLYICGTDEYGTATETKALEDKVDPQSLCDKYHALHAQVYKWFNIGFDNFGRTTTPRQTEIAQDVFNKLNANGYLEERAMIQLFCEKDQRYLADRYVEGTCPKCGYDDARGDQCDKCGQLLDAIELLSPRCKICSTTPVQRESSHMFLRIDNLQPLTEAWARDRAEVGKWSSNGRLITESWFKEGLRPFSITRDLKWGVPVPVKGMEDKVLYVWFDAPIGYPSITACYTDEWEQWWKNPDNVRLYQFMGKDNVRFHTVIFPSCLIGSKDPWTLLHHISTTEYLQYEGGKFSKSRNIGVFGDKAGEIGVPASVWRYYLLANRPETSDSQFAWRDFITRNNSELLSNLGNFCNRVLTFMKKYEFTLPSCSLVPEGELSEEGDSPRAIFVRDVNAILAQYIDSMENVKLRNGLQAMMALSARGNLFLTESGLDNTLFTTKREECDVVMLLAANLIWTLSALVHPFMPDTADAILAQLDAPPRTVPARGKFSIDLLPGHRIGKAAHLFKQIDPKMEEVWRNQFGGSKDSKAGDAAGAAGAAPVSKRQAQKAAKAAKKAAQPSTATVKEKTPEMLALEEKVKEQAEVVRKAKEAAKAGAQAGEVDKEVAALLKLKNELTEVTDKLAKLEVDGQAPGGAP